MQNIETRVAREAKVMTRREIIMKAIAGQLNWLQAADILGVTCRHMRRLRMEYERYGVEGLRDERAGKRRRGRVSAERIREVCRLKQEVYPEFSIRHFHEYVTERHGLKLSYTLCRTVLQEAGLVQKGTGQGTHRRRRERRAMRGMMIHLDASTHRWLEELAMQDLMVALDDADGAVVFARFFEQESTASTLWALRHVLQHYGRFVELYTDRASHFCRTEQAGQGPSDEQNGQVSRVCKALGIRQILARSPQARGRSERAFGTIQGRLPQELKLEGIVDYEQANTYLDKVFVPKFNERFTVEPTQPESAFVPLVGLDLELLLSAQYERTVRNDNTVSFEAMTLQLPPTTQRAHFVRCTVLVHRFPDQSLGISYLGKLLARYDLQGKQAMPPTKEAA